MEKKSETHSALQLQRLFGFTVWRHHILLFKVCSDYTLLHHLRATEKRPNRTTNRGGTVNSSLFGVISFAYPCIPASFIIHSVLQFSKENNFFYCTSSWIFLPFSFASELETAFDLPPSKLMYKPPISFILMPGSMRLDISFLKQIGKQKKSSKRVIQSHFSVFRYKCMCSLFLCWVHIQKSTAYTLNKQLKRCLD